MFGQWPLAVINMELSRQQMDIVALQETRLPDSESVKEKNSHSPGNENQWMKPENMVLALQSEILCWDPLFHPLWGVKESCLCSSTHWQDQSPSLVHMHQHYRLQQKSKTKSTTIWQLLFKKSMQESHYSFLETLMLGLVLFTILGPLV